MKQKHVCVGAGARQKAQNYGTNYEFGPSITGYHSVMELLQFTHDHPIAVIGTSTIDFGCHNFV